ncbi:fimbrial isopeptide formation D2 family protein [Aequitasia blattaphilus]|uniref:Isopeptide-forming domain-containing fimbrial protein n=1 Tax=Aequitasia blattaphilus TaxID=2949332 RepID=A0ABT1E8W2_9FIRM|nr:isopeptide-forming domain-containing fimbrial protein [Aequitasia blattaphilus]MCP1102267.1 isopeptide-forming domain-containing fimbrial protein [Aequitasia blattaphilus]MCR8614907.1 isopeptide-forming domain-containing fimbrial protein [Aequitasia blattaphilus]
MNCKTFAKTNCFLGIIVVILSISFAGMRMVKAADQTYPPGMFERWRNKVLPGVNDGMSASSDAIEHITLTESDRTKFSIDPRHYHGFGADRAESFFVTGNAGTIEVRYTGVMESLDNRQIGLKLTVTNFTLTEPSKGGIEEPIPYLSFSENIREGHSSQGISSFDIHAEFFYEDTGEKFQGKGMYFFYGSLNLGEGVIFKSNNLVHTKRLTNTNVQNSDLGWEGKNDEFKDYLEEDTFNYNSIVAETNTPELLYTVYTRSLKYTQGPGLLEPGTEVPDPDLVKEWSGYNSDLWCAISFSPMAATAPIPEKDLKVSGSDWVKDYDGVKIGDTVLYRVKQKVQILGYSGAYKYTSFSFSDTLPKEVDYIEASICKNGNDIGLEHYTIDYDKNNHSVTGVIRSEYLADGMEYKGETYQLVIKTEVNKKAFDTGKAFSNKGTTTINGDTAETNGTTTKPIAPVLSIEKTVNGKKYEEYKVGEKIPYRLVIKNTVAGSLGKEVIVKDYSLPEDLKIDASSVKVSGIKDAKAKVVHNKLTVSVSELADEVMIVSFNGIGNKTLNGKEIINTASAAAKNVSKEVQDNSKVYINSPEISLTKEVKKYEYQVGEEVEYTIKGRQTIPGGTGRDIVIMDESLPKDMIINPKSVKVTGQAKVVLNGQVIDNEPSIKVKDNKISVQWKYLQNEVVSITFTVKVPAEKNGMEIINTGKMSASNVEKNNMEAKAKIWVNSPQLTLNKRADRESKKYKVGDLVTYTVDLSNKQAGTIARNVVFKDEIKTKGVKLQKNSIVFTDSGGKVIQPASLEIIGNSFTAVLERDCVNTDNYILCDNGKETRQEKQNPKNQKTENLITLEYQAAIVEEALVGKSVENVAVVSGDNTPEEKADEVIIVPKDDTYPGLSIRKTADKAWYNVGDRFYYQLDVTNKIPGTEAKDVIIEDTFQTEGADVEKESLRITFNGEVFEPKEVIFHEDKKKIQIRTGKNLSGEDQIRVCYQGTFNERALLQEKGVLNCGAVSAKNIPPVTDDNTVEIMQKSGILNVRKKADKEAYYVGETGKYSIVVTNPQKDSVVNKVVIEDRMKTKGMISHMDSIKMKLNGKEVEIGKDKLQVQKGKSFQLMTGLDITDKDTLVITYDVTYTEASAVGQAENRVTVRGDKIPPFTDEEIVDLVPPELTLEKTADKKEYSLGDVAEYSLRVTNKFKEATALDVIIYDKLITKGARVIADSFHLFYQNEEVTITDQMLLLREDGFEIRTGINLKENEEIKLKYKVKFTEIMKEECAENKASAQGDNTLQTETELKVPVAITKPLFSPKKEISTGVRTGDGSSVVLYALMIFLALLAGVIWYRKR